MKMDKTDEHIRDNLENIMNGKWDKHFNEEQLEIAKKTSFLLNHITETEDGILFEYNGKKLNCKMGDPSSYQIYGVDPYSNLLSTLRNTNEFLESYKCFLRDWKIGNILR
jgi:hypothetical protein